MPTMNYTRKKCASIAIATSNHGADAKAPPVSTRAAPKSSHDSVVTVRFSLYHMQYRKQYSYDSFCCLEKLDN